MRSGGEGRAQVEVGVVPPVMVLLGDFVAVDPQFKLADVSEGAAGRRVLHRNDVRFGVTVVVAHDQIDVRSNRGSSGRTWVEGVRTLPGC